MEDLFYPKNKTIIEIFETAAIEYGEHIAVRDRFVSLTYRDLNSRANQLARTIIEAGTKPGEVIAIVSSRTIDFVISILATHKAGCCCLLVDKDLPKKRIDFLLDNGRVKLILKSSGIWKISKSIKEIYADEVGVLKKQKSENVKKYLMDKPAFLFFTSGTTSTPKGVLLGHRDFVYGSFVWINMAKLGKNDKQCLNLSLAAVPTVFDLYITLFLGAELIIYDEEVIGNTLALFERIDQDKINIVEVNSGTLNTYLDLLDSLGKNKFKLKSLKIVTLGAEKIQKKLLERFFSRYQHIKVAINYGCTEYSTITSNIVSASDNAFFTQEGKPGPGTRIYLLDDKFKPVRTGEAGEIYVAGEGMARGYFDNTELTSEKFVSSLRLNKEKRLYRTGDLAKRHTNGNIEILGRSDDKIFMSGFSVVPGEIENKVRELNNIGSCTVVKHKNNLVLYYTTTKKTKIDRKSLYDYLKSVFPVFMVPTYFVYLKDMPRTPNGKIDKMNLPPPSREHLLRSESSPPQNKTEKIIARIWEELLGVENVSRNDSFFNLGGDSITAAQFSSMAEIEFGNKINFFILFKYDKLSKLADYIRKNKKLGRLPGGMPFLGVDDWLLNNRVNGNADRDMPCHIVLESFRPDIFSLAIQSVKKNFPAIDIKFIFNKNKSWHDKIIDENGFILNDGEIFSLKYPDQKRRNSVFKNILSTIMDCKNNEIKFVILSVQNRYEILFVRNNDSVNYREFVNFLKSIQDNYNRALLNKDQVANDSSDNFPKPSLSYRGPLVYNCIHPTISELMWQRGEPLLYKSLMPALDLLSLPYYYTYNDEYHKFIDFNTRYLGYGFLNSLNFLNIKHRIIGFGNKKDARRYYDGNVRKNKSMVLIGTMKHVPFKMYYRTEKTTEELFGSSYFYPTWCIFTGSLKATPYIHSPQMNYLGKISEEDFWGYWDYKKTLREHGVDKYLEKRIYSISKNYLVFEIDLPEKIKNHDLKMLIAALELNCKEFKRGKIKKGDKFSAFKSLYFGKNALPAYIRDIENNIVKKNGALSDILLVYRLTEIIVPFEYLSYLLHDICSATDLFREERKKLNRMITSVRALSDGMLGILNQRQNGFKPIRITLPDRKLFEIEFLSQTDKLALIRAIVKLANDLNGLITVASRKSKSLRSV